MVSIILTAVRLLRCHPLEAAQKNNFPELDGQCHDGFHDVFIAVF